MIKKKFYFGFSYINQKILKLKPDAFLAQKRKMLQQGFLISFKFTKDFQEMTKFTLIII